MSQAGARLRRILPEVRHDRRTPAPARPVDPLTRSGVALASRDRIPQRGRRPAGRALTPFKQSFCSSRFLLEEFDPSVSGLRD